MPMLTRLIHRFGFLALTTLLAIALTSSPAAAEGKKKHKAHSYWSMSFLGGLIRPTGDMKATHKQGLVAGARLGWTGKMGLGLELSATYSPLPRDNLVPLETVETHFVVTTLGPKFTLGRDKVRLWVTGGGGVAMDRSRRRFRDVLVPGGKSTDYAVATGGTVGFDLHMLSSGGLTISASYYEIQAPLRYTYLTATGGLVFTFK